VRLPTSVLAFTSHLTEPRLSIDDEVTRRLGWLTPAFFLSGVAALIYQVAWERVLYSIFGINIESVTVVVTAFLLGLGLGSLAGGWVSTRGGRWYIAWFGAVELSIGVFGAISIPFYHAIGQLTLALPFWATGLVTAGLVVLPTLFMGATLPLLATYAVTVSGNVGWSVGTLYSVNTAGSALAACATVALLMPRLGLQGSVWIGAACNVAVAAAALWHVARGYRRDRTAARLPV
jgi:spermidine synthase